MDQLPSSLPDEVRNESERTRLLGAIRAMDTWLKPRYLNGQATIDERNHIELNASLTAKINFGELGGRLFMACPQDILRWISAITWSRLSAPGFHDIKSRRIDFLFDGVAVGNKITGKPMTSFVLSMNVDERVIVVLRQHARLDFRLAENGGVSREAFSSVPIKLRKRLTPPSLLPTVNPYPNLSEK